MRFAGLVRSYEICEQKRIQAMAKKTTFLNIIPSGDTATILLYGDVGDGEKVDSSRVVGELLAVSTTYQHIAVRINSRGGDVFEGMAIYNALKQTEGDVKIYIDGLAASIAAVIALCGKPLYMSPYAKLMLHNVSGGTYGNAEELRQVAAQMEALQGNLAEMIAKRCGMTADEVKARYMDGSDHWIAAEEAVEMGLADGLFDMEAPGTAPQTTEEIYNYFNNRLYEPIKNKDMALIDDIQAIPSFKDKRDSSAVVAHIRELENKAVKAEALEQANAQYKAQLAELKKKETEAVVDKAIADGKISQDQKAVFMSLMESDRAHTEELLKSMPATQKRAAAVFQDKSGELTGKSWDELDKAGKLGELKAQDMAAFKALYKQKFGVDYQE